jgi:hypothetical protein
MKNNWNQKEIQENTLVGLNDLNYKIISDLYKKLELSGNESDETLQCISPVIRYIVLLIAGDKQSILFCLRDKLKAEEILKKVNVSEILESLELLFKEYLPILKKQLPFIDSQVEIVSLFCKNYVYGLIKKQREINNK